MTKGKTKDGFEFIVNEKMLIDDYRFTKIIAEMEATSDTDDMKMASLMIKYVNYILGPTQADQLSDFIAEKNDGHVGNGEMVDAVNEILQIVQEKNPVVKK